MVQSEEVQGALAVVALYPDGARWGKLSAAGVLGWLEAIAGPQLPSELWLGGVLKVSGAAVSVCPCAQSPSHEGDRSPLISCLHCWLKERGDAAATTSCLAEQPHSACVGTAPARSTSPADPKHALAQPQRKQTAGSCSAGLRTCLEPALPSGDP